MSNSTNLTTQKQQPRFSVAIQTKTYQSMIANTLRDPGRQERFVASITSAVAVNPALQECEASTILAGALLGESLNLSPSPQLGQYYLVPFKQKEKRDKQGHVIQPETTKATFVLGYKGYIQLALRSGAYKDLDVMEIKQGEFKGKDPRTGRPMFEFMSDEETWEKAPTIGYMAFFEYLNGFTKMLYWSRDKMMPRLSPLLPTRNCRTARSPIANCGSIRVSGTRTLTAWQRKPCSGSSFLSGALCLPKWSRPWTPITPWLKSAGTIL